MAPLPQITGLTVALIDAAVERRAETRQSRRIGGSTIGKCERHLFYRFRWAHPPEPFSGRMLRLFETGHHEEARMIAWLREAGVEVVDQDAVKGGQIPVEALHGHFFGYLDGVCSNVPEAPKTPHLLECKTHNKKSFDQLMKHGVAAAKPDHVDQMQIYMHLSGLTRGLYLAKCKDDDTLYAERLEYDPEHAARLLLKAERVIMATEAPVRVSEDETFFTCRFCPSKAVCHEDAPVLRNCRTCLESSPITGGAWWCGHHGMGIDLTVQERGCEHHRYLPTFVPGEQFDADAEARTVSYVLRDGSTWIDGGDNAR